MCEQIVNDLFCLETKAKQLDSLTRIQIKSDLMC